MKRSFVILLVTILVATPISALATDSTEEPPVIEEASSEDSSIPESSTSVDTSTADSLVSESTTSLDLEITDSTTSDTEAIENTDINAVGESSESTEIPTEEDSEQDIDNDDSAEDETINEDIVEHIHSFEYTSNGNGTHTKKCAGTVHSVSESGEEQDIPCEFEEIENCEFDGSGKCIYCDFEKEEEKDFQPSISFSNPSVSCTIGETDPVICLYINQDDYDIAYAQVCYANYSNNSFINVGLAQGKYYDYRQNEFITGLGSGWYASPFILDEYFEGTYELRSIYIRSTTGESVHYSLETDTLSEEFQNNSIVVEKPKSFMGKVRDIVLNDDSKIDKSDMLFDEPDIERPIVSDPQYNDTPDDSTQTPNVTPTPTPKATPTPSPKVTPTPTPKVTPTQSPKTMPTPTPKATPTPTNRSILDFFKRLFGWR